jgi:phage terminase large subunit-like protein
MRSLGWLANAWMEALVVHGRGDAAGMAVSHGDEVAGFIADCYALDENGRMSYDSAFYSRPKGADKSGLGARFGLFEALGPCRFAGWAQGGEVYEDPWGLGFRYVYEPGEPMGRHVKNPMIRAMATEEGQTGNVYDSIFYNLTDEDAPLSQVGADAGLTRTFLPGGGQILPSTASSASKDGGLETFVVFDETHLYNQPELRRMYNTVTRNLRKRKRTAGTWYLETTTMFAPGEESVAETTYDLAEAIAQGRARRQRLLYDHRWGECDDLSAEDMLRTAILESFGETIEWNDIDAIVDEFYDPRKDTADSRRYFLNARTSASDAWMDAAKWAAAGLPNFVVPDGDRITLGFDGAVSEDSTALIGCHVVTGHLFVLEYLGAPTVWEKPAGPKGEGWQVDRTMVDGAVASAMQRYEVVGFYADPPYWQDYVDRWNAAYGKRMRVKAKLDRPLEWWTNRPSAMVSALARLHDAISEKHASHDGNSVLTRHVLNAKRRLAGRMGITIGKEHPKSTRKIDAAMAATLAYECRADAVAKGLAKPRKKRRAAAF